MQSSRKITSTNLISSLFVLIITACLIFPHQSAALSSASYKIDEDSMGSGGGTSSSSSYGVSDSTGLIGNGLAQGSAYQTYSGAPTPDEPYIVFSVNTTNVNLGALNPSVTQTGNATYSVKNYTSYGYIVQVIGDPPKTNFHTLQNMAAPAASATGTEQFGINVVANTSPATFGANPVQVPDNTFSFGQASTGYDTANTYKYVNGDTISYASKSSGQTDYTISYIANMSNGTPAGAYATAQTLVCTGTY